MWPECSSWLFLSCAYFLYELASVEVTGKMCRNRNGECEAEGGKETSNLRDCSQQEWSLNQESEVQNWATGLF